MTEEAGIGVFEELHAELVECAPEPEPVAAVPLPGAPETSQAQQKADATIAQTGADPPPSHARDDRPSLHPRSPARPSYGDSHDS